VTNKLALVVAVVLGVLSILGVRVYVEKIKTTYENKVGLVDVPIAGRDLNKGDTIQKSDISIAQFPHAVVDALGGSQYPANETDKIEGQKVVVQTIKSGQVLQLYHFAGRTGTRKLQAIGPEFRAMTIKVTADSGVAGLIRPGDKVDLICTEGFKTLGASGLPAGHAELKVTATLVPRVDVLAIDSFTDPAVNYSDYSLITLKLLPEDANRVASAVDASWPIHLAKLDDDAKPSSANPIFADNEYERVRVDIENFFKDATKRRVNTPGPK